MKAPFHTVLFDLDGTLVDSTALILRTYRETALEHGQPAPDEGELMAAFGTPLRDNLARFARDEGELERLIATYTRINDVHHDAMVRPFEGVAEALAALAARGAKLGVVTGKRIAFARRGLEVAGLSGYFEVVIGPEATARHKPSPDPVQEALRQLGSVPEGAAYVGDSPSDVRAGRAAGTSAVAVAWGPLPRPVVEAAGPHRWLEHPRDIATL